MERHRHTSLSTTFKGALLSAAAVVIASAALANPNQNLGTIRAPGMHKAPHSIVLPPGNPFRQYGGASYGTGGTAMRNRTNGSINISGVVGAAADAWVYWAELVTSPAAKHQKIKVVRRFPTGGTVLATVTGDLIATPADPCWGSSNAAVYRAQVPVSVATGNGVYQIVMNATESALSDGSDPWGSGVVFPAAEGASLVVIGKGTGSVYLYDFFPTEIAGSSLSYTLTVPGGLGSVTTLDSFGADGQLGASRQALPFDTTETTAVNGTQIAGPGSAFDTDADWNGNSGFPLPQLWDDIGHDISSLAQMGSTSINVVETAQVDCVIPIGNVLGTR